MLRNTIAAIIGIAAAALITAGVAAADVDMTSGNKHEPGTVAKGSGYSIYPQGTGGNPFTILTGPDCKAVNGTWVDGEGFVFDPNGKDRAWINHSDGKLYSDPYNDGISSSTRDMLNQINKNK